MQAYYLEVPRAVSGIGTTVDALSPGLPKVLALGPPRKAIGLAIF